MTCHRSRMTGVVLIMTLVPIPWLVAVAAGQVTSPELERQKAPHQADPLDEIQVLIAAGSYGEAETLAREILAQVEAKHGKESLQAARVLDLLTETLLRNGKVQDEALELARRALKLREEAPDSYDLPLAKSLASVLLFEYGSTTSGEISICRDPILNARWQSERRRCRPATSIASAP